MTKKNRINLIFEVVIVLIVYFLCLLGFYFLISTMQVPKDVIRPIMILTSVFIVLCILLGYYIRFRKWMTHTAETSPGREKKNISLFRACVTSIIILMATVLGTYLSFKGPYIFGAGILVLCGLLSLFLLRKLLPKNG